MLIVFRFRNVKPSSANNFTGLTMTARVVPGPFDIKREYVPNPDRQLTALQKLLTAPKMEASHV